eukprot:CAMPEP_0172445280 /NCGR_PEP_ID=MMETSP1065-20121228/5142_1 /TAXON_ID=265537 /ORGANISM="Amphiprora paludosa, Strain CCMP125" /LENGTH=560 /DNA_ID=CAMNT_0013196079 /DNA_START=7 /DNA_END=1689 /DNA_ORIENTATION=+
MKNPPPRRAPLISSRKDAIRLQAFVNQRRSLSNSRRNSGRSGSAFMTKKQFLDEEQELQQIVKRIDSSASTGDDVFSTASSFDMKSISQNSQPSISRSTSMASAGSKKSNPKPLSTVAKSKSLGSSSVASTSSKNTTPSTNNSNALKKQERPKKEPVWRRRLSMVRFGGGSKRQASGKASSKSPAKPKSTPKKVTEPSVTSTPDDYTVVSSRAHSLMTTPSHLSVHGDSQPSIPAKSVLSTPKEPLINAGTGDNTVELIRPMTLQLNRLHSMADREDNDDDENASDDDDADDDDLSSTLLLRLDSMPSTTFQESILSEEYNKLGKVDWNKNRNLSNDTRKESRSSPTDSLQHNRTLERDAVAKMTKQVNSFNRRKNLEDDKNKSNSMKGASPTRKLPPSAKFTVAGEEENAAMKRFTNPYPSHMSPSEDSSTYSSTFDDLGGFSLKTPTVATEDTESTEDSSEPHLRRSNFDGDDDGIEEGDEDHDAITDDGTFDEEDGCNAAFQDDIQLFQSLLSFCRVPCNPIPGPRRTNSRLSSSRTHDTPDLQEDDNSLTLVPDRY